MNKKNLLKVSRITLVIGLVVLAIAYFFFHFVGDEGIREWRPEAGKPFVTDMIGQLGVLFLWSSAMSLILALTLFTDNKSDRVGGDTKSNGTKAKVIDDPKPEGEGAQSPKTAS